MKVKTKTIIPFFHDKPSRSAKIKGTINPDFILDVEPVREEHDDREHKWFVDKNGDFIFGDGVEILEESVIPQIKYPPGVTDWRERVEIPAQWKRTGGKGIKVAVLDSGIFCRHPDLTHITEDHCLDMTESQSGAEDIYGHGTYCIGLINSKAGQPLEPKTISCRN